MSEPGIIRLRGDALSVVWPNTLMPLVARSAELRERPIRRVSEEEARAQPGRYRPMSEWEATLDEAHRDTAEEFGAAQGWTLTRRGSPRRLLSLRERRRMPRGLPSWACREDVFEHPDYYVVGRGRGIRRLVGAVVHLYTPTIVLDALPHELVVDKLPASWYMPDLTTAFLLRPGGLIPQGGAH
ncbi:MAG TPA: hypothetical protein VFU01_13130 [Gemmatimonadaceae bacterium]|nr:hypothetical protein [Gemmatimonadaceae bacterium]